MEISTFYFPPYNVRLLKKIVLVMKLTTLMLIFFCMHISAATFGQQISLSLKKVSAETVFNKIEQQTKYSFFYTSEALKQLPEISIDVKNASVEQILDKCLKNSPLSYTIVSNVVVIKPKTANLSTAQARVVIGQVTDEKGNPLPGVTIKLKGAAQGTVTSASGQFSLFVDDVETAVLQFSFIGYATREVKANTMAGLFVIKMVEDISRLDEVKIVAYGTTTKRLSTGDQTSISATDIAKYPTTNVLDVLQGSVPGLAIYKNTGNPGGSYKVQLRGVNGYSSRPPLYIVDGVPYGSMNSPNTFSTNNGYLTQNTTLGANSANGTVGQGGNPLNLINPLDIESITVLKDAEATAIYGTRAADGVIIITTKKGKAGSLKTDLSFYTGYTSVTHLPDLLNLQQYLQMRKEAKRNDNANILTTDYDINGVWDTTRSTNWAKTALGGTGHVTNAQASISGGSNNVQFLISTGYNRQTNVTDVNGSDQSGNLSFSINSKSDNNKFSVQLSGSYFYNVNTITQSDFTTLLTLAPDAPPIYNPDGTLNFQGNTFNNPYVVKNLMNNTVTGNLRSSAVISYRPINSLELKVNLGYNKQQINEFLGGPSTAFQPFPTVTPPSSTFVTDNVSWLSVEPQINFNKDISKGKISVTVGSSLQRSVDESTQLKVTGYTSDLLLPNITAGTLITPIVTAVYAPYKLSGIFGRAGYNWDNKYLLEVSGRYDGSSHFGANKQFHLFSAVGAGWVFSEENLIKNNLTFLSFGKLRGSYGVTGRDAIPPYLYLDTYSPTSATYQGMGGLIPTGLPNADLGWESTTKSEIGLELQFLKGRIIFETNFYHNRTSDLLNSTPLSQVTGFTSIFQNQPSVIQNEGFDMTVTGNNFRGKDFSWSTTVILTRDRNKLISFPGLEKSGYATQYVIGQSISALPFYSFAGVNPQTGIYQFNNKAGAVVPALSLSAATDKFVYVNVSPDYYGSVQNSFRYKQFSLDFLFRFIKQIGLNAFGQQGTLPAGLSPNSNFSTIVLNRWQKPGDVTDIQRYGTGIQTLFGQSSAIQSDHSYGDASYIRFQNLSLTYTLPQPLLKKLHVQSLQVYVQGDNLLTISKYGAIDPENQSSLSLPPLRTITSGLRLSL